MSSEFYLDYSELVRENPDGSKSIRSRDVKLLVKRLNKLALLVTASRSMMTASGLEQLLSDILKHVKEVMTSDKASMWLIDHGKKEVHSAVTLDGTEIRVPL